MFAAHGAVVIDADQLGHEVVAPGEPGLAEVVEAFGPECLEADGRLNRRILGARIFASKADRQRLNRVVHPRIMLRLKKKLRDLETKADLMRVVVVEAAVLLEAGWAPYFDRIVVVEAQPSLQVSRLTARLGLDAPQASQRVQAQWGIQQRRRYADFRISGDGPLTRTRAEVDAVWTSLQSLLKERVCPGQSG
jgi:dephospho-CoA kinase